MLLKLDMRINLPTLLTMTRIVLVPVFIILYYIPHAYLNIQMRNIVASVVFAIAGISDYLDGYFARKLHVESMFGAFLDPVADKAIVIAATLILISIHKTYLFFGLIIILREIIVSALREWMAIIGNSKNVAVHYLGKIKTVMQFIGILLVVFDFNYGVINTNLLGNIVLLFTVVLTLVSMMYYISRASI